jgi:hypothetical protein
LEGGREIGKMLEHPKKGQEAREIHKRKERKNVARNSECKTYEEKMKNLRKTRIIKK